jgi:hypothetical protein
MVQLDSGHWLGACAADCGPEGAIHWSKVAARAIWNGYERPERRRFDIWPAGLPAPAVPTESPTAFRSEPARTAK